MLRALGKPMLLSFCLNDDCCLVLDVDGKHGLPAVFSVGIQRCVGFFSDGVVGRGGKAKRSLLRTSLFLEDYLIDSLSF